MRRIAIGCAAVLLLSIAGSSAGPDVANAVMKGDRAALRKLLLAKADVNAPQVDGATAVHWAVYRDDVDALDLLVKAGARVDVPNREGTSIGNISGVPRG